MRTEDACFTIRWRELVSRCLEYSVFCLGSVESIYGLVHWRIKHTGGRVAGDIWDILAIEGKPFQDYL